MLFTQCWLHFKWGYFLFHHFLCGCQQLLPHTGPFISSCGEWLIFIHNNKQTNKENNNCDSSRACLCVNSFASAVFFIWVDVNSVSAGADMWVHWRVTAVRVDKATWVETLQMPHKHTRMLAFGVWALTRTDKTTGHCLSPKSTRKKHQLNHFNALYLNKKECT